MPNNTPSFGSFVPTSNVWDVSQIYEVDVNSPEFKELLVRLYQNINNIVISLNTKTTGYYPLSQFINGNLFFPNPALTSASSTTSNYRQSYIQAFNFGALPNTGAKTLAHNIFITPGVTFIRSYAESSDTTGFNYLQIPYASANGIDNIQLDVDAINITITTASNRTNFDTTYVVLEWITS